MSRFVLSLLLALPFAVGACSSSEEPCEEAGECPAGSICTAGLCEAVLTPSPDVAPRPDTGGVYDAGPVTDNGPARPPIDADSVLFPDVGFDLDAQSSVPPRDVNDSPADVMPPMFDVPVVNVLTLGDTCVVPDFDQGETDPCSIDNPNYYCLASLNGQSGYCTQSCTLNDHEEEEEGDAGVQDDNCGNGCCVPQDPNAQPGPGEPVDAFCRFAPDCN